MERSSPPSHTDEQGPMAAALIALAVTPNDAVDLDAQLNKLVQMVVDQVAAVEYASVTAARDGAYATVATTSVLATAVDQAQYEDQDGPCLRSLDESTPVGVRNIDTTIRWPGFRQAALSMGLHASVSIPLFGGSGDTIAALNLYGRDAAAMAPLIAGVPAIFDPDLPLPADRDDLQPLDAGGEELLSGFAEALAARSTIQLALGIIMGEGGTSAKDAYIELRLRAANAGVSLLTTAETVITHR
jgi:ANTAR domain-containing protein